MAAADRAPARGSNGESAMAMLLAVWIGVIAMGLVIILAASAIGSMRGSVRHRERVMAAAPIDSAISTYLLALRMDLASDADGYQLSLRDLEALRRPGQLRPLPPTTDSPTPVMRSWLSAEGGGRVANWQVFRLKAPDEDSADLVIVFRAWVSSGSSRSGTRPRYARVVFRPGKVTDYQLLVNTPLLFEQTAGNATAVTIDGPVHSNGFIDRTDPDMPGVAIGERDAGIVSCVSSVAAGDITHYQGTARLLFEGSSARNAYLARTVRGTCPAAMRTSEPVGFTGIEASLDRMALQCGRSVYCPPASAGPYKVYLQGNGMTVRNAQGGRMDTGSFLDPVTGATKPRRNALFPTGVSVAGHSLGRRTIATRAPGTQSAPSITIRGDVGTPMLAGHSLNAADQSASLGLVSQGDVVVSGCPQDLSTPVRPTNGRGLDIHAVVVSASGAITLDRRWANPSTMNTFAVSDRQLGALRCEAGIRISGSMVGHRAPQVVWTWTFDYQSPTMIGYMRRSYHWDRAFYRNPPPFVPTTDSWDAGAWADADLACLQQRGCI